MAASTLVRMFFSWFGRSFPSQASCWATTEPTIPAVANAEPTTRMTASMRPAPRRCIQETAGDRTNDSSTASATGMKID